MFNQLQKQNKQTKLNKIIMKSTRQAILILIGSLQAAEGLKVVTGSPDASELSALCPSLVDLSVSELDDIRPWLRSISGKTPEQFLAEYCGTPGDKTTLAQLSGG